jgi:methylase of polypeptide subunit release factors
MLLFFSSQVKRQKRRSTASIDEQIENYDYDNAIDKDNFCPAGDHVCIVGKFVVTKNL